MDFQKVTSTKSSGSRQSTMTWLITHEDSDLEPKGFIDQLREALSETFQECKCVRETQNCGRLHLHALIKLHTALRPAALRVLLLNYFGDRAQWINYRKVQSRKIAEEYITKDLTAERLHAGYCWQSANYGQTERRTPHLNGIVTPFYNRTVSYKRWVNFTSNYENLIALPQPG